MINCILKSTTLSCRRMNSVHIHDTNTRRDNIPLRNKGLSMLLMLTADINLWCQKTMFLKINKLLKKNILKGGHEKIVHKIGDV